MNQCHLIVLKKKRQGTFRTLVTYRGKFSLHFILLNFACSQIQLSHEHRKPKNLGTELKTVASRDCNGPMIHAEVQEGKTSMKQRQFFRRYGATTSCSVRMALATKNCGQREDPNIRDLFYGDSWFASFKTAKAISEECDSEFVGIVKTAHKGYPKAYIEAKMKDWPPGTHLVLECIRTIRKYYAIGYKYSKRKILCFITTEKAGHTLPGDSYCAKWVDGNNNVSFRYVDRPHIISQFFKHSNQIDKHNHARQSELAIEENVVTVCGYFRLYCTYLGITVTDAWKLYRHNLGERNGYKNISIKQFANILCKQLLHNSFSDITREDTHHPNLPSLHAQNSPPSRTSLSFPTSIVQEDATTVSSLGTSSALGTHRQIGPGKFIPGNYKAPHDGATLVNYKRKTTTGRGSFSRHRTKRGKCRLKGCKNNSTPMQCSYCDKHFCDPNGKHGRQCFHIHKESMIQMELDNHWYNIQHN